MHDEIFKAVSLLVRAGDWLELMDGFLLRKG